MANYTRFTGMAGMIQSQVSALNKRTDEVNQNLTNARAAKTDGDKQADMAKVAVDAAKAAVEKAQKTADDAASAAINAKKAADDALSAANNASKAVDDAKAGINKAQMAADMAQRNATTLENRVKDAETMKGNHSASVEAVKKSVAELNAVASETTTSYNMALKLSAVAGIPVTFPAPNLTGIPTTTNVKNVMAGGRRRRSTLKKQQKGRKGSRRH
jgi:chromosome segregation ATPase